MRRTVVALVVAALILLPADASAARLDDDLVGTRTLADGGDELRAGAPDAEMPAGLLVTRSGTVLWSREADEPRPMASTTKILTCLLVLEEADLDETVTVSARAAGVGGSGIYLRAGEELTVSQLLRALMLESSNAAATALAEHVAGSQDAFVDLMNDRAVELRMSGSAFSNPHGLDADGHHTTARDLAALTRVALDTPAFREVVSIDETVIPGPYGDRTLENSNELIGEYEGASGVKTGWTNPAGYCLVASAEREGVGLVAVVLGTDNENARFTEARRLLDWGFEHFRQVAIASVEETVAAVRVSDYLDEWVVARVGQDAAAYVLDLEGPVQREWELAAAVEAPVEEGQDLGILRAYQNDRLLAEIPLVAAEAVPVPTLWERVGIFFTRLWDSWFGDADAVTTP